MISISTKGIKVGGTLGKVGEAISSPEGRAVIGSIYGGGIPGAVMGYASTEAGRDKIKTGFDKVKGALKGLVPGQGSPGVTPTDFTPQSQLAQDIATRGQQVSQQGIQDAQGLAGKFVPTTAAQATMPQTQTLQNPMVAPTLAQAAMANSANVGPAAQVSPQYQQTLANMTPEQIQSANLQNTQISADTLGRDYQSTLAQQLVGQATGVSPSLAELKLKQDQENALKNQIALAATLRGPSAAAQLRGLNTNLAEAQQKNLEAAQVARLQEQTAAQQQLGQVATDLRSQDVQLATQQAQIQSAENIQQAQFEQQASLANQQSINTLQAQKAELELKAAQGDQNATNQLQQVQAQLDTQVHLQNASSLNDMSKMQAQLEMQARTGNQQAQVELQKLNAQLEAQTQQFNASQQNELAKQNQAVQAQYQQMQNDLIKYYTDLGFNAQQAQLKTLTDIANATVQQNIAAAQAKAASKAGMASMLGGLGSAAGAIIGTIYGGPAGGAAGSAAGGAVGNAVGNAASK